MQILPAKSLIIEIGIFNHLSEILVLVEGEERQVGLDRSRVKQYLNSVTKTIFWSGKGTINLGLGDRKNSLEEKIFKQRHEV